MTLTQIWYHMKVHLLEIIICQSVVKLKKPTLEMIQPNQGRVRIFTPGIICSADHSTQKKKLGNDMKRILLCKIQQTLQRLWGMGSVSQQLQQQFRVCVAVGVSLYFVLYTLNPVVDWEGFPNFFIDLATRRSWVRVSELFLIIPNFFFCAE